MLTENLPQITIGSKRRKIASIAPIYDKYYGEGGIYAMKKQKKQKSDSEIRSKVASAVKNDGSSRNELMLKARDLSIKNFRVLNKEELAEAVTKVKTDPKRVQEIIDGAVKRWKSGWGSKSKKTVAGLE